MSLLYKKLSDAVVEMDEKQTANIALEILDNHLDPLEAIELGLMDGMQRVGDLYENEEYFITELLVCADAMNAAMDVFKPHIINSDKKSKGRIVIGSIEGDTHDIGKNIVALIIESAGFDLLDLGRDVSPRVFVDKATEFKADIIAISTLMTTTMDRMGDVIKLLEQEKKRDSFKVIVGGKPVSLAFAKRIGADGYSASAPGALRLVKELLSIELPHADLTESMSSI
ncbi:MAG: corrinoid protein [Pyrinomonadaceae bacterium]|nr:corrinoid protein [Sphingobacteriaceae bacterium]